MTRWHQTLVLALATWSLPACVSYVKTNRLEVFDPDKVALSRPATRSADGAIDVDGIEIVGHDGAVHSVTGLGQGTAIEDSSAIDHGVLEGNVCLELGRHGVCAHHTRLTTPIDNVRIYQMSEKPIRWVGAFWVLLSAPPIAGGLVGTESAIHGHPVVAIPAGIVLALGAGLLGFGVAHFVASPKNEIQLLPHAGNEARSLVSSDHDDGEADMPAR